MASMLRAEKEEVQVSRTDNQTDRQGLLSLGRHEALTNRSQSPKGRSLCDVRMEGLPQKQKQLGGFASELMQISGEGRGESTLRKI